MVKIILAIADDALRLVEGATFLYQFDLGDIWKRKTGLPFIFAVCAVHQEFSVQQPELLADIHRELLRCRDEGRNDLEAICEVSASRIPLSKKNVMSISWQLITISEGKSVKLLKNFLNF